jgi:hypothetical protein
VVGEKERNVVVTHAHPPFALPVFGQTLPAQQFEYRGARDELAGTIWSSQPVAQRAQHRDAEDRHCRSARLSPSIHLLDVRQLPQITPSYFLLGEAQKL